MRITIATAVAAVALAVTLSAHDHYRVIGTVTKMTADEITVKQNKDGNLVEMDYDKKTTVLREDKTPGVITDVKVGSSVVIDGYGDDMFDLLVLEIRLVPPIGKPKKPPVD
jgi:hypothetical protein